MCGPDAARERISGVRYRKLTASGDYQWGSGSNDFYVNEPAAVGQACVTRLLLPQGEWFLDKTAIMPWSTRVFVEGGRLTADQAIRAVILGTQGVNSIVSYSSSISWNRGLSVEAAIETIYGEAAISTTITPPAL
jgi:hypothetical protein